MPDFNVRSDSVNVEQIMEQIRARIREKRGVDYTEQQLRELAAVKLEKFLDPRGVRSDLLDQFKRRQPTYEPPVLPSFTFEDTTIYETHRGVLAFIRRLLNPIFKLFFNPNTIVHALHTQADLNKVNAEREAVREKQRLEIDALYYEVIHNLVFEMTRLGIETKNLKMRVESIGSRLEFNERRARALESAVVYRSPSDDAIPEPPPPPPPAPRSQPPANAYQRPAAPSFSPPSPQPSSTSASSEQAPATSPGQGPAEGPGQRSRRRRRRRGRRGGTSASAMMSSGQTPSTLTTSSGQAGSAPAPATTADRASPADADQPASPQTTDTAEPRVSLEQAFATDVQPTETRAEEASPAPAPAPRPEPAEPAPGTSGDPGDHNQQ